MLIIQRAEARPLGSGLLAMLNSFLVWASVILAAAAFGGFLFGLSSIVTLADRFLRPQAMALRAPSRLSPSPRLWA
jgi:hypothetical protein